MIEYVVAERAAAQTEAIANRGASQSTSAAERGARIPMSAQVLALDPHGAAKVAALRAQRTDGLMRLQRVARHPLAALIGARALED